MSIDELKEEILQRLLRGESLNDVGETDARHAAILELGQEGSVDHGEPITIGVNKTIARIPSVRLTARGKERAEKLAAPQALPE